MILSDEDKIVFEGVHSKEVHRRVSLEKLDNGGVNKLLKSRGTQAQLTLNRRPGSGKPRSARTEENTKLLLQKFP